MITPRSRSLWLHCARRLALLAALLQGGTTAFAAEPASTPLVSGLGITWGMAALDSDTVIFTQRDGRAGLLTLNAGKVRWLSGLPEVHANGQGGLLDVAIPGRYRDGDWIYFTYSKPVDGSAATTLARARLSGTALSDWQDLLVTRSQSDTNRHFGSRIAFDNNGHLFFSIGDRGDRSNGQNLMTHAGSILRLQLDGGVPADNPFVGRDDALPEIYSYGHRNPQGLCYDDALGGLWSSEHGPRGGDEINFIQAGANYGWPVVSHGKEYWGPFDVGEAKTRPGMEDPRYLYIPSIAPGSLLCYSSGHPQWQRSLFQGALKLTHLNRVSLDDKGFVSDEKRLLNGERIRALLRTDNGDILYATDSGTIARLSPGQPDN